MAKPTVQPRARGSRAKVDAACAAPAGQDERQETEVVASRGTAPWKVRFLARLAETSNVTAAAAQAQVQLSRVYKEKRDDGEFAARWREALCEGYDLLEIEVLQRLRFGEPKEVGAKFDNATALRLLSQHRETVARERAIRDNADVEEVRRSLHAKLLQIRDEVNRQRSRGPSADPFEGSAA